MARETTSDWSPQSDSGERYQDWQAWTDDVTSAASRTCAVRSEDQQDAVSGGHQKTAVRGANNTRRPRSKKKRVISPGAVVAGFIGLVIVGAAAWSASGTPEPTRSGVQITFTMPDVGGENLQVAQDLLQSLGSSTSIAQDASGQNRLPVVDSDWTVCAQQPAATARVLVGTVVVLASVMNGESCPDAAQAALAQPAGPEVPDLAAS